MVTIEIKVCDLLESESFLHNNKCALALAIKRQLKLKSNVGTSHVTIDEITYRITPLYGRDEYTEDYLQAQKETDSNKTIRTINIESFGEH